MDFHKLTALLEDQHQWPGPYLFKFIIPTHKKTELFAILSGHEIVEKPSKNGRYLSVTSTKHCSCADEVIKVYKHAITVEGIMSL